jgi:hypothetical protein
MLISDVNGMLLNVKKELFMGDMITKEQMKYFWKKRIFV